MKTKRRLLRPTQRLAFARRFVQVITAAVLAVGSILVLAGTVRAQDAITLSTLHQFSLAQVAGGLVQGSDGNFYGVTFGGGTDDAGSVYRVNSTGTLTTLYNFSSTSGEGYGPDATLVQGADGNFYGTAKFGGANGEGTAFRMTTGGTLTTLHSFGATGTEGIAPNIALIQGSDGNFYGATYAGGAKGEGTVFRLTPAGAFTTLHSFGATSTEGSNPFNSLVQGSDGNFYGTTVQGGAHAEGTVFMMTPAGTLSTLHSFGALDENDHNSDGSDPFGALIQGSDGNFYGTTAGGGVNGTGTVFRITSAGSLTTLHTFGAFSSGDGDGPGAALVQGNGGTFYGTTGYGGTNSLGGTVFQITSAGSLTILHNFDDVGSDGTTPQAPLVRGSDGNFYSTTLQGGTNNQGTVFRITPAGSLSTLHRFDSVTGNGTQPQAAPIQGSDGDFYGTTQGGGVNDRGTVFRFTPAGALTTLHTFGGASTDGADPVAALVQGSDGDFYGTTEGGGANGKGTVYRMTSTGSLTTLHSFDTPDGASPLGELIQAKDGNFYGTAASGGTGSNGTVYRITPAGSLTPLHLFDGADGSLPYAALIQGGDGNFYGTTSQGGAHSEGTVFQITPAGKLTTLHTFGSTSTDGVAPTAALIQGSDGDFYGSTVEGGTNGSGTIFRITPAGSLTILHSFGAIDMNYQNSDGANPAAALVTGPDGNFYGTTSQSGPGLDSGTIFRLTPAGGLTTLYGFPQTNSEGTASGVLALGSDGNFYGTTSNGGSYDYGSVFRFALPALNPVITSAASATGTAGQAFTYQITASHSPTSYGESGLPTGLGINQTTGKISGTPKTAGTYKVTLAAFNSSGHGSATLTLTVKAGPPAITSATSAAGTAGAAFSYQITASNSPTKYGESGLPAGLSINQTTGKISGTPRTAGTYTVTIAAFNSAGSGSAKLTLTVKAAAAKPVITSSLNPPSRQGVAFSYQITATNNPTSYGESGLPAGLTINQTTGKITGTPTKAGTYTVTIAAFNSGGAGTATLTLVVKPPA